MRSVICARCGKVTRSNSSCCVCGHEELVAMSHEQAAASVLIKSDAKRLAWFKAGGKYRRAAERRRWRPEV